MTNENETTTTRDIITTIDPENQTMIIKFSNGKEIVVDVPLLSLKIRAMAMMHGLKQKLVDAAAISRNPDTGRTADIDDKYNAVKEVYDRLISGEWNKKRGEGAEPRGGLLFAALCRLYPAKSPDVLREWLGKQDKKTQAQLRANPKIAAIIDEIRAEGAGNINTDELLSELEG